MDNALVWLHVSGNLVWIGSILAVGVVMVSTVVESKVRGKLASDIYRRLAVPAFIVAFVAGMARLLLDPGYYLAQHHWMHPKLLLAFGVIALHHVIGARARKMALGSVQERGPAGILTVALAVAALGAAFFAVLKIPN
jgi:protoporphyrinogen IX oxidase